MQFQTFFHPVAKYYSNNMDLHMHMLHWLRFFGSWKLGCCGLVACLAALVEK
jgi:hypothetical protein